MRAVAAGAFSKDKVVAEVVNSILHQALNLWHVRPSHPGHHHDTCELQLPVALDEWL